MGEFSWGPESPSNVNEGGTFRRAGEDEPEVEVERPARTPEMLRQIQLNQLMDFLNENNLRAKDIVESKKRPVPGSLMTQIRQEVPVLKNQAKDSTILELLEILARKEEEERKRRVVI